MNDEPAPETDGFDEIFRLRPMIVAYCQRRGSRDPEGIAAETMSIAWQQREKLDPKDCRPWLIATARNLLFEEYRARRRSYPIDPGTLSQVDGRQEPAFEIESLDAGIGRALDALSPADREAVLLVAWEDLTPTQAAKSMGIRPATFRVRLHRARRRMRAALERSKVETPAAADCPVEENA